MKTKTNNVVSITAKADAKAAKVQTAALPKGKMALNARLTAAASIRGFYDACYQKGGVMELQEQLAEKTKGLSAYVMAIATQAVKIARNDLKLAAGYFTALCQEAEKGLQEEHKENGDIVPMTKLLPSWAPYKSSVAAGLGFGLNPGKFATEGAFREAVSKARAKSGKAGTSNRNGTGRNGAGNRAKQGGFIEELNRAMAALSGVLQGLDESAQKKAAVAVRMAAEKISALHPKKAEDKPEKAATRRPARGAPARSEETVTAPMAAQGT